MNTKIFIPIAPVPKPRMTRSDKWKQRPCVIRYREFKDQLRDLGVTQLSPELKLTFYLPMPTSWSVKKRNEMLLKPHQQKPDIDNLIKSLLDAIELEDSYIWNVTAKKFWDFQGSIAIEQDAKYNKTYIER